MLTSQQKLRESEERLRLALATTQQGLYDLNVQNGEVTVNPEYASMLGFEFECFLETADSWRARLHPDDQGEVTRVYQDYIAGVRSDYRVEFRLRTRTGGWIWIYSVGAIVAWDSDGKPLRMLGTHLNITERKEAELRQKESDLRLNFALDAASIGDWSMDLRTNIAERSLQHDRCFGYTSPVPEWGYETFLAHVHERDRERVNQSYMTALNGQGNYEVEFRAVWPDSSIDWLLSKGRFYFDENDKPYRVAGIQVDVTSRKTAELSILDGERRYSLLLENCMDGVLQVTVDGAVIAANSAACAMFCLNEKEMRAIDFNDLVDPKDARLSLILAERQETGQAKGELSLLRGDGSRFEAEVTTSIYSDHAENVYTSMVLRDITDRKKAEADINQLAFFDTLTGLPNRRLLIDRLERTLASARRSGLISALMFIDLDRFKSINDARGHAVGDAVLKYVGQNLSRLLRQDDTLARIGGDEFVVLMNGVAEDLDRAVQAATVVVGKIHHALTIPTMIEDYAYTVSASIGVTMVPNHAQSAEDLLQEADTAMYRAKKAGRNQSAFFELAMQAEVEE